MNASAKMANALVSAARFLLTRTRARIEFPDTMNRKPLPPDHDIKNLAKKFRGLQKPCQTVRAFLRENAQLFRELRQDGWSWAGLGLGLAKAGIKYDTGKAWTGDALVQAFSRAQVPLKGYARRRKNAGVLGEYAPVQETTIPLPASSPAVQRVSAPAVAGEPASPDMPKLDQTHMVQGVTAGERAKPASRFKPVSIRPLQPRHQPTAEELAEIEQNRLLTFGRV